MDVHTWLQIVQLAAILLVIPIYRGVSKIRGNELAHIGKDIEDIGRKIDKLSDDFQKHLEYHAYEHRNYEGRC